MPSAKEKRRETLVASPHQNSTWWKLRTGNLSVRGFLRMKLENPTRRKGDSECRAVSASSSAMGRRRWYATWARSNVAVLSA